MIPYLGVFSVASEDNIIEIKGLSVYYLTVRGYVEAVDDVDLNIRRGEIVGIVGESGSGKSTLALAILRLLPTTARIMKGSIYYNGKGLVAMDVSDKITMLRKGIVVGTTEKASTTIDEIGKMFDEKAKEISYEKLPLSTPEEK